MKNDQSLNSIVLNNENGALTKTELLKQLGQQEILLSISNHIASISSRKELFAVIISEVQRIIPIDDTAIIVLNENGTMWQDWTNVDNYQETEGVKKFQDHNFSEFLGFLPHHKTMEECFKQAGVHTIDHYLNGGHPFAPFMYESGLKEFMFTPLIYQGKTIGSLFFDSKEYGTYSERYFDTFKSIANMIASAVANIVAKEEILAREKEVLLLLSQKISKATKVDELLQIIVSEVKPIFNFYDTGILVVDETANGYYDLSVVHPQIDGSEMNDFLNNQGYHKDNQVLKLENSGIEWIIQQFNKQKIPLVFDYLKDYSSYSDGALLTDIKNSGYIATGWMCPLVQQGKTFGVFSLNFTKEQTIPIDKKLLFLALADRIASSLSNILANEEILEREREKTKLLEITELIAQVKDTQDLLRLVIKKIQPMFHFHDCGLFVISPDGSTHRDLAAVMPDVSPSEWNERIANTSLVIAQKGSPVEWVMEKITRSGKPILTDFKYLVEKFPDYPQFDGTGVLDLGYRDCLAFNLIVRGKTIGMFCINALQKDFFKPAVFSIFQSVTESISIAVANILANEEILEREKEKTKLLEISEAMAKVQNHTDLLLVMYEKIKPMFHHNDIGFFIVDDENDEHYEIINETIFSQQDAATAGKIAIAIWKEHGRGPFKHSGSGVDSLMKGPVVLSIDDFANSLHPYVPVMKEAGLKEFLGGPIMVNGKPKGMFSFNTTRQGTYSDKDFPVFQNVLNLLSTAVANILANEEILEREREKTKLLEISEAIATVQNSKQLLKVIYEKIKPAFDYDSAGLFILDKEGKNCYEITDNEMLPDAVQDEITKRNLLGPFPMSAFTKDFWFLYEKPTITTISQQAEYVSNIVGKAQFEIGIAHGLKDFICGPLNCGGKKIGMLCFSVKKENYYTDKDLSLFKSISDLIAVAVANILANEEILDREREKTRQLEILETLNQCNSWAEKFTTVAHKFDDFIGCDLFSYSIRMDDGRRMGNGFLKEAETDLFKVNSIEQYLTDMGISETRYQELYRDAMNFFTGSKFFTASTLQEAKKNLQLVKKSMDAYGSQSLMFTEKFFTKGSILFILTSKKDSLYNASSLHFLETTAQQMTLSVMNILDTEEIEKQFIEIKELKNQLEAENIYLQQEVKNIYNFDEIIGQSEVLHEAFDKTNVVALTDASVLLLGETGTGKELFARAIHNASNRQKKALIKINCAALPPHLIESELFGHERGAFTGAFDKRIGKFELAHESTLFLDEIGELPLDLQGKLLRALQEKEIERLGSNKVIKTDIRIIAATNRDLETEVEAGRFRADLYFRLNVFPIHLPALRERQEDIPLLVSHFIARFSKKFGKPLKGISTTALQTLKLYPFPGNVRELEHIIERSCILAKTPIIKDVFVPKVKSLKNEEDYSIKSHQENELEHIEMVLNKCEGKIFGKGGAAEVLGLPPTTLIGKMKKLGIKK
jgi:formate hydrogenlyase transcriptional activator